MTDELDLSEIKPLKILNANGKGTIQLSPAEAAWIAENAGKVAMDAAKALKANQVPIARIRGVTELQNGLATLSNKAHRAYLELTDAEEPEK